MSVTLESASETLTPRGGEGGNPAELPEPGTSRREKVYQARTARISFAAIWGEMCLEFWESRELTWRLFLRDLSARYRQSLFGYVWAVVPVVITTITFAWLNRTKVMPIPDTGIAYPLFVLVGTSVWQLFASGLSNATQSLVTAGGLITKINFPRETLVNAAVGQALFDFVVRIVVIIAGFAYFRVAPAWTALALPLVLIPLCLFTLGVGYLAALANGILRDTGQVVTFALTFWMFLTPVIYPPRPGFDPSLQDLLNPVRPMVIAARDMLFLGHLSQPAGFAIGSLVSCIVFLSGWRIFHLTEPRIAERV